MFGNGSDPETNLLLDLMRNVARDRHGVGITLNACSVVPEY